MFLTESTFHENKFVKFYKTSANFHINSIKRSVRINTIIEIKEKHCEYAKNNSIYFKYIRLYIHCPNAICCLMNCPYELIFFRSIDKRNGDINLFNYKLTSIIGHHTCNCEDGTVDFVKVDKCIHEALLKEYCTQRHENQGKNFNYIVEVMACKI